MSGTNSNIEPASGSPAKDTQHQQCEKNARALIAPGKLDSLIKAQLELSEKKLLENTALNREKHNRSRSDSLGDLQSATQPTPTSTQKSTTTTKNSEITVKKNNYQTGLDRYITITSAKRKLSPQKQNNQTNKMTKVSNTNQSASYNRFSVLAENDKNETANKREAKKPPRPTHILAR